MGITQSKVTTTHSHLLKYLSVISQGNLSQNLNIRALSGTRQSMTGDTAQTKRSVTCLTHAQGGDQTTVRQHTIRRSNARNLTHAKHLITVSGLGLRILTASLFPINGLTNMSVTRLLNQRIVSKIIIIRSSHGAIINGSSKNRTRVLFINVRSAKKANSVNHTNTSNLSTDKEARAKSRRVSTNLLLGTLNHGLNSEGTNHKTNSNGKENEESQEANTRHGHGRDNTRSQCSLSRDVAPVTT